MIAFDNIQPSRVTVLDEARIGLLQQSEEEVGMTISSGQLLAALDQPLQRELPDRRQHDVAWFSVLLFTLQETGIKQGGHSLQHSERRIQVGYHLGRLQGA